MIYKFKSKASGDVIMLGPNGDRVLAILGREPSAKGIIEPAAMPAAIAALHEAVREDEALRASLGRDAQGSSDDDAPALRPGAITLRQRVWPLVDMLQRCHAADEPVVWGA